MGFITRLKNKGQLNKLLEMVEDPSESGRGSGNTGFSYLEPKIAESDLGIVYFKSRPVVEPTFVENEPSWRLEDAHLLIAKKPCFRRNYGGIFEYSISSISLDESYRFGWILRESKDGEKCFVYCTNDKGNHQKISGGGFFMLQEFFNPWKEEILVGKDAEKELSLFLDKKNMDEILSLKNKLLSVS